jgi:type IV secretory pathway VirB10-like protein
MSSTLGNRLKIKRSETVSKKTFSSVSGQLTPFGILKKPNKPDKPKAPPPPPPPPPSPKDEGKLSEDEILRREKERKGRKATILTSARGDTSKAPTQRKTLLGQ